MLDPEVALDVIVVGVGAGADATAAADERDRAARLGRAVNVFIPGGEPGPAVVHRALDGQYDLVVLPGERRDEGWAREVLAHAPCPVSVVAQPPEPVTA